MPFIIKNDDITLCGYANGYVAVPITHPLYVRGYFNDIEELISIHGGLTFSDYFNGTFDNIDIIPLTTDNIPKHS